MSDSNIGVFANIQITETDVGAGTTLLLSVTTGPAWLQIAACEQTVAVGK